MAISHETPAASRAMTRQLGVRFSLIGSGLRFRAWNSLALLLLASLSIAAGAFGPIYLHSADQSLLTTTLGSAPVGTSGLSLEPAGNAGTAAQLDDAAARVPGSSGAQRWFGPAIYSGVAGITGMADGRIYVGALEARTGVCTHLHFRAGHCADASGEVVLSARSATLLGVRVGQRFTTSLDRVRGTSSFIVSGLYETGNPQAAFWWGNNPFGFGPSGQREQIDAVFTEPATLNASVPPTLISNLIQFPYALGSLRVDDTGRFLSAVKAFQHVALSRDQVLVETGLPGLLGDAAADEHTTTTIIAVIDLQFLLLSLIALYFVAASTTSAREPDVRVAALRGYRRRSMAAVALAEPSAIALAAVPLGLALAWLLAVLSAGSFFGPGVGASLTPLALGAAIATGAIGLIATALGSRKMLALSGIEENEAASPRSRTARWQIIADVAAVSVAAAAFIELAVVGVAAGSGGSSDNPLAASAPALLAVAIGVLVSRALPVLVGPIIKRTKGSRRVAWFLATRRIARRGGFATKVMLVGVAASLIVFAVSGWFVFSSNLDRQTVFSVGAGSVATVNVRPGVDLLSAVRHADPDGRAAMAVVIENASDGTTIAVDASRMSSVMSWPSGLSSEPVGSIARQLVPSHLAPSVELVGSSVRLQIDSHFSMRPPPVLDLDLFNQGYGTPEQIDLGALSLGARTYTAALDGQCVAGCRLVDLALTWSPTSSVLSTSTAHLLVSAIAELSPGRAWLPVGANLQRASDWTGPSGGVQVTSGPEGLGATLNLSADGGPVALAPRDVPMELPVVATPAGEIGAAPGVPLAVVGLDGTTINGQATAEVPALPRVGNGAVLADLATAETMMTEPFQFVTTQVWFAPHASSSVLARLRAEGVTPVAIDNATLDETQKAHGGNALAYKLFLLAALGAVFIAVAAGSVGLLSQAGRRRDELVSLRIFGLRAPSLRRSLALEELLIVGAGVVVGAVSGVLAAVVALKSVPEFVNLGSGPPLVYGLPVLLLLASMAALTVAFVIAVAVSSNLAVQAATPYRAGDVA